MRVAGVGRRGDEPVDERIARAPHAGGAVDEIRGERTVLVRHVGAVEHCTEDQVGVGTVGVDPLQGVEVTCRAVIPVIRNPSAFGRAGTVAPAAASIRGLPADGVGTISPLMVSAAWILKRSPRNIVHVSPTLIRRCISSVTSTSRCEFVAVDLGGVCWRAVLFDRGAEADASVRRPTFAPALTNSARSSSAVVLLRSEPRPSAEDAAGVGPSSTAITDAGDLVARGRIAR